MNLNGDEKRIQRLFREMSLDDAQRMPQFARVLEAASSRRAGPRQRIRPTRLAAAVAILLLAALIAVMVVRPRRAGSEQNPAEQAVVVPAAESLPREVPPNQNVVRHNV